MQLKQLIISLEEWGVKKGQYSGTVKFANESGEIQINVHHDASKQILEIIASQIAAEAKRLGKLMTADVLEAIDNTPKLEA